MRQTWKPQFPTGSALCGGKCSVTPGTAAETGIMGCAEVVCVAATSTHGSIEQQWRLSVRLDDKRALLLRRLSIEAGIVPSDVIR